MHRTRLFLIGLTLMTSPLAMAATTDSSDVQKVMDTFHHAVLNHDGAQLAALFIPGGSTWLNVLSDEAYARAKAKSPSATKIRVGSYKEFATFVSNSKVSLDPRHSHLTIHTDGTIATAYFDFDFMIDGKLENHGSETWQLVKGTEGWRIAAVTYSSNPPEAQPVEMTPEHWQADGQVSFRQSESYPHGIMQVTGAGAILKNTTFSNGTIEYDINEDGDEEETSGIWFHRQSAAVAEDFYLRPFKDCATTAECVQYAPVSRGNVQWDVYPEYQAAAPVRLKGWNHVKLVISGKRMNVFINGETKPSLIVGCLGGEFPTGGIQLRGNALYANLTLAQNVADGLSEAPLQDPTDTDPGYVRHWQLSPIQSLPRGQTPQFSAIPSTTAPWQTLDAERKGFVNIGRHNGTPEGVPDLAWLKTNIESDHAQTRHVTLGWVRQIWVYVNGTQVFAGNNVYYPESARTPPLGRLSLQNGSFDLPLRKGPNEVEVAISDDLGHIRHWGWGYQLRLDNTQGLRLPDPPLPSR